MNYIRHLNAFFQYVRRDDRLACSHVSLYLALFQYWNFNRFQNPFPVYRTDIMKLCKIGSKNTYHKCIKQLHEARYIIYHPAPSPYQPVKISLIRLDKQVPKDPTQLTLFGSLPTSGRDLEGVDLPRPSGRGEDGIDLPPPSGGGQEGGGVSTNNDTPHVPYLTTTSINNNTQQVPKMGQLIKLVNLKNVKQCQTPTPVVPTNPPHKQNSTQPHVPNMVHGKNTTVANPTLLEIQLHFKEQNYPIEEADKFYYYNQSKNWMLTEKFRIRNWKSLVKKWMLNHHTHYSPLAASHQPLAPRNLQKEIQYLYESWLEGKDVDSLIKSEHFHHCNLQLSAELMNYSKECRIIQLSGSNRYSNQQLLLAYQSAGADHDLILKDLANLKKLAMKLAVIQLFNQWKMAQ